MTISAKIIEHSISPRCINLITVFARYPRFVHAELMTHRVFSRNASSSRAIPVQRLIDDILNDTAMPMHWGKNQPGMQAREEHDARVDVRKALGFSHSYELTSKEAWLLARDKAVEIAQAFSQAGYAKQIVNRILEPFANINVLITSTEWSNFFELRDHPDAQPEIQALARAIKAEIHKSKPNLLEPGEWHLPYVLHEEKLAFGIDVLQKLSVARCARTSYLTHDGKAPLVAQDLDLYDRLVGARPLHASPAEHQAMPDVFIPGHEGPYGEWRVDRWQRPDRHGNLKGWVQFRKLLEEESR